LNVNVNENDMSSREKREVGGGEPRIRAMKCDANDCN
jgi:hypothetical protein